MHPLLDALPTTLCYLDGVFVPLRDAKVSVLDRGFIFGDGVYEVVPAYEGRAFCFDEHMARLSRSLAALQIAPPLTNAQWRSITQQLLQQSSEPSQAVYCQVTRGVALRDHAMPAGLTPTVFAMVNPMKPVPAALRAAGVRCVTAEDFRWQKAHIKATSLLGAVLARQISVEAGAYETIMFRGDWLSEASSSNLWVVKNGALIGVPSDERVLTGIRYSLLERLCAETGTPFSLQRLTREDVFAADELLLSSATRELLPVTTLDDRPVGNAAPGPIYDRLYAAYQRAKQHTP